MLLHAFASSGSLQTLAVISAFNQTADVYFRVFEEFCKRIPGWLASCLAVLTDDDSTSMYCVSFQQLLRCLNHSLSLYLLAVLTARLLAVLAVPPGRLSFHLMAQCVVHALKGLACRARVTTASSPALHCKQCSALTSPLLHARGCARPSCAR
jgi:hypothetical protein